MRTFQFGFIVADYLVTHIFNGIEVLLLKLSLALLEKTNRDITHLALFFIVSLLNKVDKSLRPCELHEKRLVLLEIKIVSLVFLEVKYVIS